MKDRGDKSKSDTLDWVTELQREEAGAVLTDKGLSQVDEES